MKKSINFFGAVIILLSACSGPSTTIIKGKIYNVDNALQQWNVTTRVNKYSDEFNLQIALFELKDKGKIIPGTNPPLVNSDYDLNIVYDAKITIDNKIPEYVEYTIKEVDESKQYVVGFIAIRKAGINTYDPIPPPKNIKIKGGIFASNFVYKGSKDLFIVPVKNVANQVIVQDISFLKFTPTI